MKRSVCVIYNPTARGEKARSFQSQLGSFLSSEAIKPTLGPGSACILAAQAVQEGFETIVAAGGDGTLN